MAKLRFWLPILIALLAAPVLARASVIYTNNFDAAATCGAASCLLTGGSNAAVAAPVNGFSGNQRSAGNAVSGPIGVTFTGLSAHDAVSIDFLVALLNSWDGINCCTDVFTVRVDGVDVLRTIVGAGGGGTTDYFANGTNQAVPGSVLLQGPGGNPTELNLGNDDRLDDIAHTASTLTVQFLCVSGGGSGCQNDDNFALDNLSITLRDVAAPAPEPATLGLLGFGIAGLGLARRRRS